MDKYIKEDGGAGDWGTDKARAKLQQDSPGQKIKRKGKMKRFREVLEGVDEAELDEFGGRGISAADKENLRRRIKDKKKKESVEEDEKEVEEAMSPADKAKRLKMIKQAVEKMNKSNMERAKKDALQMMKDSGMFDEELEEAVDEKVNTFTSGHKPDPKYTYKLMIDGELEGEYQSLPQAQAIVKNRQKIKGIPRKFNITKHPRKKLSGPKGKLPESTIEEAVQDWTVTVTKPVNKLKKGAAQKVKARSAFEAINKAVKLWGDPALKAAPMNSFSIQKEGFRPVPMFEDMSIETFAKFYS